MAVQKVSKVEEIKARTSTRGDGKENHTKLYGSVAILEKLQELTNQTLYSTEQIQTALETVLGVVEPFFKPIVQPMALAVADSTIDAKKLKLAIKQYQTHLSENMAKIQQSSLISIDIDNNSKEPYTKALYEAFIPASKEYNVKYGASKNLFGL